VGAQWPFTEPVLDKFAHAGSVLDGVRNDD
jgi:hypothetical protein